MSFGQGMVVSYSWKQKQMARSLTEGEIIGVDDLLGHILWARYLMQAQFYDMKPLFLYQDNMSAILLEINRKSRSSKQTRHMNIKFFFSKEKNDNGQVRIKHCPTKQMWTDIKPKQGAVFW